VTDTKAAPRATSRVARRRQSQWGEWPSLLTVVLLLSLGLKLFVVQAFFIPSGSMEQTLHGCDGCANNDRVLVDKLGYRFHDPRRGDIVVFDGRGSFTSLEADRKDFIKRVIGLPGELVECCDFEGRVLVNDQPIEEPYVFEDNRMVFGPVVVPEGHLWVMGDHRCCSDDSRVKGTVPIDRVVGRAFVTVWPPSRMGGLR
jgi:signal peptidase I